MLQRTNNSLVLKKQMEHVMRLMRPLRIDFNKENHGYHLNNRDDELNQTRNEHDEYLDGYEAGNEDGDNGELPELYRVFMENPDEDHINKLLKDGADWAFGEAGELVFKKIFFKNTLNEMNFDGLLKLMTYTVSHKENLAFAEAIYQELLSRDLPEDVLNFCKQVVIQAVYKERLNLIKWSLDQGVSANIKDAHGNTLLHLAADRENVTIIELLFSRGANASLDEKDSCNRKPEDIPNSKEARICFWKARESSDPYRQYEKDYETDPIIIIHYENYAQRIEEVLEEDLSKKLQNDTFKNLNMR